LPLRLHVMTPVVAARFRL